MSLLHSLSCALLIVRYIHQPKGSEMNSETHCLSHYQLFWRFWGVLPHGARREQGAVQSWFQGHQWLDSLDWWHRLHLTILVLLGQLPWGHVSWSRPAIIILWYGLWVRLIDCSWGYKCCLECFLKYWPRNTLYYAPWHSIWTMLTHKKSLLLQEWRQGLASYSHPALSSTTQRHHQNVFHSLSLSITFWVGVWQLQQIQMISVRF